jgi:hypothetical protein
LIQFKGKDCKYQSIQQNGQPFYVAYESVVWE